MIQESTQEAEEFLRELCRDPNTHAKFLNTLSFLEYIGARKILKSQRAEWFSVELLSHVAEEIRHAQVLKKIALKMSSGKLDSYQPEHLFCGSDASRYIQTVDQESARHLNKIDPWVNYLLTTFIVEERANWLYAIYAPLLSEAGYPGYLNAILREEENHLKQMVTHLQTQNPDNEAGLFALQKKESEGFSEFLRSLRKNFNENSREQAAVI